MQQDVEVERAHSAGGDRKSGKTPRLIERIEELKKELIDCFKNPGVKRERAPMLVNDHDFRSEADGIAHGVYDLRANTGPLFVGTFYDTPGFAVECVEKWWRTEAASATPTQRALRSWAVAATLRPAGPGSSGSGRSSANITAYRSPSLTSQRPGPPRGISSSTDSSANSAFICGARICEKIRAPSPGSYGSRL